jgi:hypothetical protein
MARWPTFALGFGVWYGGETSKQEGGAELDNLRAIATLTRIGSRRRLPQIRPPSTSFCELRPTQNFLACFFCTHGRTLGQLWRGIAPGHAVRPITFANEGAGWPLEAAK